MRTGIIPTERENQSKFRVMHLGTKPNDLFCTAGNHHIVSTEEQIEHLITDQEIT